MSSYRNKYQKDLPLSVQMPWWPLEQYFTLPHLFRRNPLDSSGLQWTLPDSRHVTYHHMEVRRSPVESSGVIKNKKKTIVHKRNLVLSAGVRQTRLHQSEKKDTSPETGFLVESAGVCQTGLYQSEKKRTVVQRQGFRWSPLESAGLDFTRVSKKGNKCKTLFLLSKQGRVHHMQFKVQHYPVHS